MKKSTFILAVIVLVCFVCFTCRLFSKSVAENSRNEFSLVVLHTNDHHGCIEPKNAVGGLALRSAFINQMRKENKDVLLLDAGDINTGSALSNMFRAEPDILAYNQMKYDAVALGNHEFDHTMNILLSQIDMAEFPFVCANIQTSDGKYLDRAYIIKTYQGVKVAIFGLTTLRTETIASPDKSLIFLDEIETAKKMVTYLRSIKKADIVILLSHMGFIKESENHVTSAILAQNLNGIDLIVDGHSHIKFDKPEFVNNIPIVSANEMGK